MLLNKLLFCYNYVFIMSIISYFEKITAIIKCLTKVLKIVFIKKYTCAFSFLSIYTKSVLLLASLKKKHSYNNILIEKNLIN